MPELDLEFETGDDLQVAGFYEWVFDGVSDLSVAAGAQKTWHEGEPDRDLIVARLDYLPPDSWDLRAATWVDLYDRRRRGQGQRRGHPGFRVDLAALRPRRLHVHLPPPRLPGAPARGGVHRVDLRGPLGGALRPALALGLPRDAGRLAPARLGRRVDRRGRVGGDCEIGADVPDVFVDASNAGIALFATDAAFSVDAGCGSTTASPTTPGAGTSTTSTPTATRTTSPTRATTSGSTLCGPTGPST
jgi:hypothetical protein